MPSEYFNAFDVCRIAADGERLPLPQETFDVDEVGVGSIGTVTSDNYGRVAAAALTVSLSGAVVEFSHATYPEVFRRTMAATETAAEALFANLDCAYVAENLYAGTTEAVKGEIWVRDLDDPEAVPQLFGYGQVGETAVFPFESVIGGNWRVRLQPVTRDGQKAFTNFEDAPYVDIVVGSSIPAAPDIAANLVYAGPSSGLDAPPAFRSLVAADIPSLDAAKITSGTIATARLGSGTANNTTYLRGDQTWQTIASGIAIGNAVTGGGANRVLYEDGSQNLAASSGLTFDGTNLSLTNPNAASGGTPSQPSPYLYFNGASWSGSASVNAQARLRSTATHNAYGSGPGFIIDFNRGDGFGGGGGYLSFSNPDYLTTRLDMRSPSASGHGGMLEATYDGQFAFKNTSGALSGLQPGWIAWNGAAALGYQNIRPYSTPYGITFQSAFGTPIQFKNPESGFGSNYPIYMEPDLMIGASSAPSAALHILKTTEQFRVGYDASNCVSLTVGSTGGVTIDAVGSGAAFAFSDDVSVNAKLFVVSTAAKQASVRYDGSNRLDTTVDSTGGVTFDAVGSGAAFGFSDPLTVTSATGPQGSIRYDASNRLDITAGSTGIIDYDAVGSGAKHRFNDDIELTSGKFLTVGGARFRGETHDSGDPSTTHYPSNGDWGLYEDDTGPKYYVAWNFGGTIFKVELI